MKKLRKSLNKKLLFSIVLLCVIISVVSCVIGFLQYNNTIRRLYNENGYMLGSIILEQIDGDRIAEYAQTWTRDAYYRYMRFTRRGKNRRVILSGGARSTVI